MWTCFPFKSNLIFFFTLGVLATIMSFKSSLVSLCFPLFPYTHSLFFSRWWTLGAHPDWFSSLSSLCVYFRQCFLFFSFCSILVYLEIRGCQEESVLQKQSSFLSFHWLNPPILFWRIQFGSCSFWVFFWYLLLKLLPKRKSFIDETALDSVSSILYCLPELSLRTPNLQKTTFSHTMPQDIQYTLIVSCNKNSVLFQKCY